MQSSNQKPAELQTKPYSPPKLIQYGDIKEVTRAAGNMGNLDGGTGGGMMSSQI